jgi:hypothetical protein
MNRVGLVDGGSEASAESVVIGDQELDGLEVRIGAGPDSGKDGLADIAPSGDFIEQDVLAGDTGGVDELRDEGKDNVGAGQAIERASQRSGRARAGRRTSGRPDIGERSWLQLILMAIFSPRRYPALPKSRVWLKCRNKASQDCLSFLRPVSSRRRREVMRLTTFWLVAASSHQ